MECNSKYTMFENYHTAAKDFANGDMAVYGRLMYILNCYGIENVLLDDLSPVEKLFITSVKASIDKSLEMFEKTKRGGAPKGNKNASKNKDSDTEKNNYQNNYVNNYQTNEEEGEEEEEREVENEEEKETPFDPSTPLISSAFSKEVFNIFNDAGLPCCNSNFISFIQRDFKNGIEYLHHNIAGLHSDEVIGACRNYVTVAKAENMWFKGKFGFEKFVQLKNFKDFLPDNFRIENFLKDGEELPKEIPKKKKDIEIPAKCSDCGAKLSEMNRLSSRSYFCKNCHSEFHYEGNSWMKTG